jgi:hypothetical protein
MRPRCPSSLLQTLTSRAHSLDRPLPPAGHLSTPVPPTSAPPGCCPGLSASPPPSSRYQGTLKHWFYFPAINSFPFRHKSSLFPLDCIPPACLMAIEGHCLSGKHPFSFPFPFYSRARAPASPEEGQPCKPRTSPRLRSASSLAVPDAASSFRRPFAVRRFCWPH